MICNECLASESLKPAKLKRYLDTRHASYSNKFIQYFERKLESLKKQKHPLEIHVLVNKKYLRASYEASYLIANAKKLFTIAEDLLLPVPIRMTNS